MRRIDNIYINCMALFVLASAFTYLVEDVKLLLMYFVIAFGYAAFTSMNKYMIAAAFLVYVAFAVTAQLAGAEWFYHDMPEKIDRLYILMNFIRASIFIAPICSGVGVSWLIARYLEKRNSGSGRQGRGNTRT